MCLAQFDHSACKVAYLHYVRGDLSLMASPGRAFLRGPRRGNTTVDHKLHTQATVAERS